MLSRAVRFIDVMADDIGLIEMLDAIVSNCKKECSGNQTTEGVHAGLPQETSPCGFKAGPLQVAQHC